MPPEEHPFTRREDPEKLDSITSTVRIIQADIIDLKNGQKEAITKITETRESQLMLVGRFEVLEKVILSNLHNSSSHQLDPIEPKPPNDPLISQMSKIVLVALGLVGTALAIVIKLFE